MKVIFGNGVTAYSGKLDQVVYQSWFKGLLCLARKFRLPTETAQNAEIGSVGANLDNLLKTANPLYLNDLKAYAAENKKENAPKYVERARPMGSSQALFMHCMYEWQKTDPTHIDLKTITIADMVTMMSPVCMIMKAVDAKYLKRVSGYTAYTHEIQG